jgi:hypothetical protein
MSKVLLLSLALWLAACAVPAHPPRRTLNGEPARFVTLPLELGNGDEVTVHGEASLYVTNFTPFFRTFCDTLVEVWRTLCGPHRCLPRPWAIVILEKDAHTALVGYPDRAPPEETGGVALPVILHAYRLGEQVEAVLSTSQRAALEVATALCAKRAMTERAPGGCRGS